MWGDDYVEAQTNGKEDVSIHDVQRGHVVKTQEEHITHPKDLANIIYHILEFCFSFLSVTITDSEETKEPV